MLAVIIILSVLVIVHELGHFFVARMRGVKVEEFGIGYPPKALSLFTWLGTRFTLNWIPFGGFVRLAGEDQDPDQIDAKKTTKKSEMFYDASSTSKLLIILAGAFVNFVFGVLLFSAIFTIKGIPEPLNEARIGEVAPGSPAAEAQMPTDVTIVKAKDADGLSTDITTFSGLVEYVGARPGQTITLVTTGPCDGYKCDETEHDYSLTIRTPDQIPAGQGALGVVWGVAYVHYPWYEMPLRGSWYGLRQAVFLGDQILSTLKTVVVDLTKTGKVPSDIAGPVGIVHQAQTSGLMNQGFEYLFFFAGMLSINLAVMNVLPIPPLDGGRALFILLATVLKKKSLAKVEYYANYSGYVLLVILIILVTIRDVLRVIG